jgi:hypothetical protein
MRLRPKIQPSPLIKFEDMSLAMFSQLKFLKPTSALISSDDESSSARHSSSPSCPRLQFMDELSHPDH